jgi:hypothetical protein
MRLKPRIVLHSPVASPSKLEPFVEQCLLDGVQLIAVVGDGCADLEEEIDWIVVGDGLNPDRYLTTSSHPNEPLQEVLDFASSWSCEGEEGVQQVRL